MSEFYSWQGDDLILYCHIQPRASRDAIQGQHGDALKVAITAPPVDGAANTHLLTFFAEQFGVPKKQVHLLSGETGRKKRFKIESPRKIPTTLNLPKS